MHFHVYLPFAVLSTNMTSFPPSTCQFYSTIKTRTNAIFLNLPLNPLGKMLAQSLASPLSLIKIFLPSLLCSALCSFICFQEGLPLPLLLLYRDVYYRPGMLCPALLPATSPCPSFKTQLQHCFPAFLLPPLLQTQLGTILCILSIALSILICVIHLCISRTLYHV